MTRDERYLLLKSVFCQMDDEDDDDIVIIRRGDKNDCELAHFDEIRLRLWSLSPPRLVRIDCCGDIKNVSLLRTVRFDRPEINSLSEENWDIPAVDRALLQWATDKANDILKTVKMLDGSSARPTPTVSDDMALFADKLIEYLDQRLKKEHPDG